MSDEIAIISTEQMKSLIYEIRGQKVMLDKDLAKIYGYETKNFNRQVKNNIEKFPDDFMFQLTYDEALRCNFFTLNKNGNMRGQHIKYLPYAFTEQGIYMLMTVLKGELATQQSLALIRIFKSMKDYMSSGSLVSAEDFLKLSIQTNENRSAIARLETEVLKKSDLPMIFKAFSDENANEYLFMNGELCEAAATYQKIYSKAKKSIYIIDDYISLHTLLLFRHIGAGIDIVIYSDNKQGHLSLKEYNQFITEYPHIHLRFVQNNYIFHDRYIILDHSTKTEKIFHCGASSKDAGRKITTITESKDKKIYHDMIEALQRHQPLILV